jgi:hypothetical protein
MKIAVLIYGMYREFDIAISSWDFLKKLDCDVYFSTWSTSKQRNKKLDIIVDEEVTEKRILDHVKNARISISDDIFSELTNPEKMIFHWKSGLEMIKKHNIKYDYLMLTRPDNYFAFNIDDSYTGMNFSGDSIYGLEEIRNTDDELFIQDIFFLGKFELMQRLIENIPRRLNKKEYNGSIHHHLAKHILLNGLEVKKIPKISVVTVRANSRQLNKEEISIDTIFKKTMDWGNNQDQYYENNL